MMMAALAPVAVVLEVVIGARVEYVELHFDFLGFEVHLRAGEQVAKNPESLRFRIAAVYHVFTLDSSDVDHDAEPAARKLLSSQQGLSYSFRFPHQGRNLPRNRSRYQ